MLRKRGFARLMKLFRRDFLEFYKAGLWALVGTVEPLRSCSCCELSRIEGKWESFQLSQQGETLIIAGSDPRGAICGIYDLSEKMGVSPWY